MVKTLALTSEQSGTLLATGRVEVRVRMEPQPRADFVDDGQAEGLPEWRFRTRRGSSCMPEGIYISCPFPIGARLDCPEPGSFSSIACLQRRIWLGAYEADNPGGIHKYGSAEELPPHMIRHHPVVVAIRVKREGAVWVWCVGLEVRP